MFMFMSGSCASLTAFNISRKNFRFETLVLSVAGVDDVNVLLMLHVERSRMKLLIEVLENSLVKLIV